MILVSNKVNLFQVLIQRRPRKGTKKLRSKSVSSARGRSASPILSRMAHLSDSDDSDISSVSSPRKHKQRKAMKKGLKTVRLF